MGLVFFLFPFCSFFFFSLSLIPRQDWTGARTPGLVLLFYLVLFLGLYSPRELLLFWVLNYSKCFVFSSWSSSFHKIISCLFFFFVVVHYQHYQFSLFSPTSFFFSIFFSFFSYFLSHFSVPSFDFLFLFFLWFLFCHFPTSYVFYFAFSSPFSSLRSPFFASFLFLPVISSLFSPHLHQSPSFPFLLFLLFYQFIVSFPFSLHHHLHFI